MQDNIENITHYYRIKMSAFSKYLAIVWNRFNWFLTLTIAVFGVYFNKIEQTSYFLFQYGIPTIGIVLSFLWLFMGVEDYLSLKRHKAKVSSIDNHLKDYFHKADIDIRFEKNNNYLNFTQSTLLFLFPGLAIICWLIIWCLLF